MTADTAGDMLLDTSISMPPPVPAPETVSNEQDEAVATPPMHSTADAEAIASAYLAEDVGGDDVDMPSIQIPDEAALAAAAAAMAAAAQGLPDDTVQPQTTNVGIDGTGDLNSYLLAAAAASVHAQQQGNGDHKAHSEDSFGSTATPSPTAFRPTALPSMAPRTTTLGLLSSNSVESSRAMHHPIRFQLVSALRADPTDCLETSRILSWLTS